MGLARPWNRVSQSVYSLVTFDSKGRANMNICTYISAISLHPKLFSLALTPDSKSYSNMVIQKKVVLQYLSQDQASLTRPLGKKSGHDYDKMAYLQKKNLLFEWRSYPLLKGVVAAVELLPFDRLELPEADHELWIARVLSYKNFSEEAILTTDTLKKLRIIA